MFDDNHLYCKTKNQQYLPQKGFYYLFWYLYNNILVMNHVLLQWFLFSARINKVNIV